MYVSKVLARPYLNSIQVEECRIVKTKLLVGKITKIELQTKIWGGNRK
jgi:hypothetical protein